MKTSSTVIARLALSMAAAGFALTACGSAVGSNDAPPAAATSAASADMAPSADMKVEASDEMASSQAAVAAGPGAYVTLAEYEGSKDMYADGDVVLFFNASWCPTCKEATTNLESDPAAIPAGLTIVSVDYDNSAELKTAYGITTQHTFVQVDADGNELARWSGSVTAAEIAKQTA